MSKYGVPLYKPNDEIRWYYWINEKQEHANGFVWAKTLLGAMRKIRRENPGCVFDAVMSEEEYHN